MEKKGRDLLKKTANSESGRRIAQNMDALQSFAASDEGKRLLKSLGERGAEAAAEAADGLQRGDAEAVKTLVRLLSGTPEGRALADSVINITENRKHGRKQ